MKRFLKLFFSWLEKWVSEFLWCDHVGIPTTCFFRGTCPLIAAWAEWTVVAPNLNTACLVTKDSSPQRSDESVPERSF